MASGVIPTIRQFRYAMQTEIKINNNYQAAQKLFSDLLQVFDILPKRSEEDSTGSPNSSSSSSSSLSPRHHPQKQQPSKTTTAALTATRRPLITPPDITDFQIALATLIRCAPSPEQALEYVHLVHDLDPPLRDLRFENTVLIDIIQVYARFRGNYVNKALDFAMIGLERGLALPGNKEKHVFKKDDVFEQAIAPILRLNGLRLTEDRLSAENFQPRFSVAK